MVEQTQLDTIFHSLADATRRDILLRVAFRDYSISDLAEPYDMSFAAVAKHVAVLQRAGLVSKYQQGKQHIIRAEVATIQNARLQLEQYEQLWNARFATLDHILAETKK